MKNNEYITKDLYIASTLHAQKHVLQKITQENKTFYFHFLAKNSKELSLIQLEAEEYWRGNILIDPKELFTSFKELKTRMRLKENGE